MQPLKVIGELVACYPTFRAWHPAEKSAVYFSLPGIQNTSQGATVLGLLEFFVVTEN